MKRQVAGIWGLSFVLVVAAACSGGEPGAETEPLPTPTTAPTATSAPTPTAAVTPVATPTTPTPQVKSLAYLSADVAVPELPASFASAAEDPALAALIRTTLSGYQGSYSVVVHNLEDGRSASLNSGRVYYSASLFKVALLLEAYRQRDAGEIDLSQLLTLERRYLEYDFGTLELLDLREGDMFSVADALKAMIIVSDTPTAVMVQDLVNPARVDQTLRALGATTMSVTSFELPTTAGDMALLMEAVAAGSGVSAESRREMLVLLLQEGIRGGIPAGVAADAAVAHKTGNFTHATHDVALVWGPGGPYVIAVLTDRSWDWEPVVAVSRAVWDYFAANP